LNLLDRSPARRPAAFDSLQAAGKIRWSGRCGAALEFNVKLFVPDCTICNWIGSLFRRSRSTLNLSHSQSRGSKISGCPFQNVSGK
jgi:hypothetical protein